VASPSHHRRRIAKIKRDAEERAKAKRQNLDQRNRNAAAAICLYQSRHSMGAPHNNSAAYGKWRVKRYRHHGSSGGEKQRRKQRRDISININISAPAWLKISAPHRIVASRAASRAMAACDVNGMAAASWHRKTFNVNDVIVFADEDGGRKTVHRMYERWREVWPGHRGGDGAGGVW